MSEKIEEPVVSVPEEVEEPDVPEPVKVKRKLGSNMVNVKVLVGTLNFEDGTFQKGETFQVQRSQARKFAVNDVEISEIEP